MRSHLIDDTEDSFYFFANIILVPFVDGRRDVLDGTTSIPITPASRTRNGNPERKTQPSTPVSRKFVKVSFTHITCLLTPNPPKTKGLPPFRTDSRYSPQSH